ncbi:hypothetical protein AAP_00788 [Ascosphaera apis ARSEF 7405]|uniref:Uncharacterized protein n=1 Tax=Ascosphaera apis ARSEF 7405 TaxID=392613 RepID=A0A168CY29_9EURO|nr:hypothetical protein AAP_00788 [Ascosphaera apis ARSEF 7405]
MVAFRVNSVPASLRATQPEEDNDEYGSGSFIFATQQNDITAEVGNGREDDEDPQAKKRKYYTVAGNKDEYETAQSHERFIRRALRWHYFFTFSNDKIRAFIHRTFPDTKEDYETGDSYERALRGATREWKYETLKRMKNFVAREMRNQETAPGLGLACIDAYDHLHRYFTSTFDEDNFYEVFYWLKGVMDLERSSELGRWYAKEIFSNLATKCKIYLSKVERGDKDATSYWDEIKLFWASQGTNEKLAGVGKEHYKERVEKPKKSSNKKAKERQNEKIKKLHKEFVVSDRPAQ